MNSALKFFLWLHLAIISIAVFSQTTYNVSGKVLADDLKPLVKAGVYVSHFSTRVFTDSTGSFKLQVKPGLNEISFSYTGYYSQNIKVYIDKDTLIEVQLKSEVQLSEVVITDDRKLKTALYNADGSITLKTEDFYAQPAMLGENDPVRSIQMQSGIQSGNEGLGGLLIHGGGPDESLVLMDGVPVFNISHLYSFISVFNADAIDKVDIYKDSYPARFGGRLSSVMDVETNAGNNDHLKASISIGLIISRFHLDGPIGKNHKTTFSLSMRGCYAGLISLPVSEKHYKSQGLTGRLAYYFQDSNLKLLHRFNDKDKIALSFFSNNDFYLIDRGSEDSYSSYSHINSYFQQANWANYVSSVAWTHDFSKKWKWQNSFSFSNYSSTYIQWFHDSYIEANLNNNSVYYTDRNITSYLRNLSYKSDIDFLPDGLQSFKAGALLTYIDVGVGNGKALITQGYVTDLIRNEIPLKGDNTKALEASAYIEDEIRPTEQWLINCGFHARSYTVSNKTFFTFLPRLNIVFTPVKKISIFASVSGTSQNLHFLIPNSTNVLATYWVPAKDNAPPETGWNYVMGIKHKLPLNFEWGANGFYRSMKNLVDYKDGVDYSFSTVKWEQQVYSGGIGRAYGLEMYVARSYGKITGSIAYTLAWSDREFTGLNYGAWFPYAFDRRHDFAAQLNYVISKHFEVGAAWIYGSGNMVTLPEQRYNNTSYNSYGNTYITAYTSKNAYRLPSYQHLDISFTYRKQIKHTEHVFNFSVYNVYNHYNIFEIYSVSQNEMKQLSLFPVLPSLSYTIKFGV